MPTIQEIAGSLTATREEFERIFHQAQVRAGFGDDQRVEFKAVTADSNPAEAVQVALRFAQTRGFLDAVIDLILVEQVHNGRLTELLSAERLGAGNGDPSLQAVVDVVRGFADPYVFYRGFGDGISWTCKVLIDGGPAGTGILVGPNLVLTAWHVIKCLFVPTATGQYAADPGAGARLCVSFEDILSRLGRAGPSSVAPQVVPAHSRWCVAFSPCHDDELEDRLPADLTQLKGNWDYAIFRLAQTPGLTRRWASLSPRSFVPSADERIVLFQHPQGLPLKMDENYIAAADEQIRSVIAELRFLHYANSVSGSSGGPCFDRTFRLFGIHQGVWKHAGVGERVTNRGVPVLRVLEHIMNTIGELPGPDPSETPVWNLGPAANYAPALGTEEFQSTIWRSVMTGVPRIVAITGEKGRGKSFRIDLLNAMLPDGAHLKVTVNAQVISKLGPREMVRRMCDQVGASLEAIAPLEEVATTPATWLKDTVLPAFVEALNKVRGDRMVWLSIKELNTFRIEDPHASALLYLLYESIPRLDWLRIVLDGMRGDIPEAAQPYWQTLRVAELTRADIEAYVRRLAADANNPNVDPALIDFWFDTYQEALDDDTRDGTKQAAPALARSLSKYAKAQLRRARP